LCNPNPPFGRSSKTDNGFDETEFEDGSSYLIKLALQDIYRTVTEKQEAVTQLKSWYGWARHSRLEPVKEFAKTIKNNWNRIVNYFEKC
jgi:transposase